MYYSEKKTNYQKAWGQRQREQSIELLRIVLMTLIVFGHILGHGLGDTKVELGERTVSLFPLYFYHVDAFVFISGYFGIHLKWKKFLLLISKMVVYSFVAIGLAVLLKPELKISMSDITLIPQHFSLTFFISS